MPYWTIELRCLFLSWHLRLNVHHLLEFLHVRILRTKEVEGKAFLSHSSIGSLRYFMQPKLGCLNSLFLILTFGLEIDFLI